MTKSFVISLMVLAGFLVFISQTATAQSCMTPDTFALKQLPTGSIWFSFDSSIPDSHAARKVGFVAGVVNVINPLREAHDQTEQGSDAAYQQCCLASQPRGK